MNLLPCPFCGHHATIEESDLDGSPVTGCTNDLCPLGDERFSMTIEQWNTRATDPELVLVPQSALDWLDGSGPGPDGKWFDDDMREPKTKGMYWWRSEFRRKIAAAQEAQDE